MKYRLTPAQRRFYEGGGREVFRGGRSVGASYDHQLDAFRYWAFMVSHRTVRRPSWLHPFKRVLWVHEHGPHVPFVVEEIPPAFSKLRGVT